MGLNTRGGSANKTFINVFQGNMVIEYSDREKLEEKLESLGLNPEDIKVRKKTKGRYEGQEVFYHVLFDISGYLDSIVLKENDYGEFVELGFTDIDDKYIVSIGGVSGRMAKDFVRRMDNIDLNEEMVFGVWNISADKADNGKPKSGVRMYQNGDKLEYAIQFDELPEPTSKKRGRKTTWDFSDQDEFIYESLTKWMEDNFTKTVVTEELPSEKVSKPSRTKVDKGVDYDDVPF